MDTLWVLWRHIQWNSGLVRLVACMRPLTKYIFNNPLASYKQTLVESWHYTSSSTEVEHPFEEQKYNFQSNGIPENI